MKHYYSILILALYLCTNALPSHADVWNGTSVATGFSSGSGSSSNPYIISSAKELVYFLQSISNGDTYSGKYIKLAVDVDLNKKSISNINGTFAGDFDGDRYKIENLNDRSLFYDVSGTIHNLYLKSAYSDRYSYPYGIVFRLQNGGIIYNCSSYIYTYGYITGSSAIAYINSGSIVSCTAEGLAKTKQSGAGGYQLGGVAYYNNSDGVIIGCSSPLEVVNYSGNQYYNVMFYNNSGEVYCSSCYTGSYVVNNGTVSNDYQTKLAQWKSDHFALTSGKNDVITSNTANASISFSRTNPYEWEWDSSSRRIMSSNKGVHNSTSKTTININLPSVSKFSFDYFVSSEDRYDKLYITLDGIVIVNGISGSVNSNYSKMLGNGSHTLVLEYTKNENNSFYSDQAYISNMRFTAATPTASGNCGMNGSNVTWSYYSPSLLVLSGSGQMANYSSSTDAPWYKYRSNIEDVQIASGITSIGDCSLYGCSKLTQITLPNTIKTIGRSALGGCNFSSLVIPEGVQTIGYDAFTYNPSLTSVSIPSTVTTIDNYAFYQCTNIQSVNIADVTSWCKVSFGNEYSNPLAWCVSMREKNLYLNGEQVEDLIIPEGVTSLSDSHFACCNIQTVTLPKTLTSIGNDVFCGGDYLKSISSVTSLNTTPPSMEENLGRPVKTVYVPASSVTAYKNSTSWSKYNIQPIPVPTISISLNRTSATVYEGNTLSLSVIFNPNDATDRDITWTSNNTSVATVSNTGLVTAIKPGNVTITAETTNGLTATCTITVTNPITSISFDKTSLLLVKGSTSTLTVTFTPSDVINRSLIWTSDNTAVATVSSAGLVTAVAPGTATITATTTNGKTATCEVTVENQTINLVDGAESFVNEDEVVCKDLTYTRTISDAQVDKYQALYVPMKMDVASLDERIKVYKIMAMFFFDLDGDGENDESYLRITPLNSGVLMPNHAYIFKASEAGTYTFNSYDNVLYTAEINELTCSTTEIDFTFKGNYVKQNPGISFYGLSGGAIKNGEGNVGSFRWYATMSDKAGQLIEIANTKIANAKITIFDDDMTDVESVVPIVEKHVEGIYSVNGNKLSAPQRGMNIIKFTDGTTIKHYNNR